MQNENHAEYMKRALELAVRAAGRTSPNPMVGAVLVKGGRIIGEGYHKKAGTAHAEAAALREAGKEAAGATLYVTLEPCNHHGKTPPCSEAVIKAGVSRVYAATTDPNPLVAGSGIRRLKEAGIETHVGLLEEEAIRMNEFFFTYITTGLPFVTVKTAMTLDGKICTHTGDSRWITGEASRNYVHRLRDTYDVILVGIGTVNNDNPRLDTRLPDGGGRNPVRAVLDGHLSLSMASNVVETARLQKTIIYCAENVNREKKAALTDCGVEVVASGKDPDRLPLEAILRNLAGRGLISVMVEGGSRINGAFLDQRLVDKIYWYIAPKIVGGEKALTPVAGQGVSKMKEALTVDRIVWNQFGSDMMAEGYLK